MQIEAPILNKVPRPAERRFQKVAEGHFNLLRGLQMDRLSNAFNISRMSEGVNPILLKRDQSLARQITALEVRSNRIREIAQRFDLMDIFILEELVTTTAIKALVEGEQAASERRVSDPFAEARERMRQLKEPSPLAIPGARVTPSIQILAQTFPNSVYVTT